MTIKRMTQPKRKGSETVLQATCVAGCAALALMLAACGGGTDGSATGTAKAMTAPRPTSLDTPGSGDSSADGNRHGEGALVLGSDNAASVIDQILQSSSYLPKTVGQFYRHTYSANCQGGSVSTGTSGTVRSATLDQCVILNSRAGREVVNGAAAYRFAGPAGADYPVFARFDGLTLEHIGYDASGKVDTLGEIRMNGDFNNTAADAFSGTGSFSLDFTHLSGTGGSGNHDWDFRDYRIVNDPLAGPKRIDGRIAFGTPSGYVNVATDVALSYDASASDTCPLTGTLTIDGGDNTSLGLAFDGGTVTVTLNGNADSYSCTGFDRWLGDTTQPFAPRQQTINPPLSPTSRSYSY